MFGTGKMIRQLQRQLERMEAYMISAENGQKETESVLSGGLADLRAAANKHDMAIADMLDTWDEWRQSQREESGEIRTFLSGELQKKAADRDRRETALLELIMACHDQIYSLRRTAAEAGDYAWARQFDLMEEKLSDKYLAADLRVIDGRGVPVNYNLHEVLDIVETGDGNQAARVADVYSRGYIYRGQVIRKAVVAAFRLAYREQGQREQDENMAARHEAAEEMASGYSGYCEREEEKA